MLDQANEKAIEWASAHSGELVTGLDRTTQDLVNMLVEEAEAEGWSNDRLAGELENSEAFGEKRAMVIARTETAMADVQGNLIGYAEAGVERKQWIVGEGCCPECAELNGETVALDDVFSDGSDAPPAHPNCRCDILPVMDGEDQLVTGETPSTAP